jgi:hypothetical protein
MHLPSCWLVSEATSRSWHLVEEGFDTWNETTTILSGIMGYIWHPNPTNITLDTLKNVFSSKNIKLCPPQMQETRLHSSQGQWIKIFIRALSNMRKMDICTIWICLSSHFDWVFHILWKWVHSQIKMFLKARLP